MFRQLVSDHGLKPKAAEKTYPSELASHRDGPIFLNILRVLDVPAALGLLAPRPLILIGAKGDAWSLTKALYERAGAATELDRK